VSASTQRIPQHVTGAASLRPRPSRIPTALTLAALGLAGAAGPARAEKFPVTQQAASARAAFLAYAPAPAQIAGLCLVDSGVNLTPDTQAAISSRAALDGGPVDDVDPARHGTLMAMVAAAPLNDFGMVGAWPAARITSLRAQRADASPYSVADYVNATNRCTREAPQTGVKVINLSLGGQGQLTTGSEEAIDDAILRARQLNINVVAAAGNSGAALDAPASRPLAFAVGASTADSALCDFSARGEGLDLAAPGCALNVALPDTGEPATASGTSHSAVFVAAVLAALRSYRRDLDPAAAEELLQRTARPGPAGALILDVEAAFAAAGLQSVIDAGRARIPTGAATPTTPPGTTKSSSPSGLAPTRDHGHTPERAIATAALTRPSARASYRRGILRLRLRRRPKAAVLRVEVFALARNGLVLRTRTLRRSSSTVTLRLPRWDHLVLSYEDLYGERRDSTMVRLRHTRAYPPRT